jgi:hypothetical protein
MGSRSAFDWNDAAIERLRVLWFKGYSASECGAFLGCSRNACIGKIHRLKWHFKERQPRPLTSRVRHLVIRPPPPEPPPKPKRVHKPKPVAQLLKTTEQPVSKEPPAPFSLSLLELGPRHCKWPCDSDVLPYTFCGALREEGSSYCPKHHYRAHYKGTQADIDRTIKGYHFGKAAA